MTDPTPTRDEAVATSEVERLKRELATCRAVSKAFQAKCERLERASAPAPASDQTGIAQSIREIAAGDPASLKLLTREQAVTAIANAKAWLAERGLPEAAPASGGVDAVTVKHALEMLLGSLNAIYEIAYTEHGAKVVMSADTLRRIAVANSMLASLSPAATPVSEAGGDPAGWVTRAEPGSPWHITEDPAWYRERGWETAAFYALAKPASSPAGGDVGGWQPMSTAPKDGDEMLATNASLHGGFPQVVYWEDGRWHVPDAGLNYHPEAFTHWRRDCLAIAALSQSTSSGRVGE